MIGKAKGFTHDNKKNITHDWWTPKWIFDELGLHFDLDPCAPPGGVPWIPAKEYYTAQDNGLVLPLKGIVWLNPPYGTQTGDWLLKMHNHHNGIALVFARTDCRWFHDYVAKADLLLFLKGRISFVDGLNKTKSSGAGAGSMLAAWGPENAKALNRMAKFGFLATGVGGLK